MKNWVKKVLRFTGKAILVLLVVFLVLFAAIWSILKFPAVQNYLVTKATHFVSSKTGTRVELGHIDIAFPKSIVLERVFLEDKNKDTLVYLGELEVDVNMLALLKKKVEVGYLGVKDLKAQLKRDKKSQQFNFQFLIDAFASKDPKPVEPKDTTSSPWSIGADKLAIKNSRFILQDSLGGIYLTTFLPELEVELGEFDLEKKGVVVDKAHLLGLNVALQKGQSLLPDTSKSDGGSGWDKIDLNDLQIEDLVFDYKSHMDSTSIFTSVGLAELSSGIVSLVNESVKIENFELQHTQAKLGLRRSPVTDAPAIVDTVKKAIKKGWMVEAGRVYFHDNSLAFDYSHNPPVQGIDFNHLAIAGLHTEIKEVFYQRLNIKADIHQLQAQEKNSGFGIRSFKTDFRMDSSHVEMQKLDLVTNHSRIGHSLYASYASMDQIMATLQAKCRLEKTRLAVQELFLFAPQLKQNKFLAKNANRTFLVDLNAEGSMKKMLIRKLDVRTTDSTQIIAKGEIRNATETDKLLLDLDIQRFYTTQKDLHKILPDSMLPSSIALPAYVHMSGQHKGTLSDFATQLRLQSSFGDAHLVSSLQHLNTKNPKYDVHLITSDFELGKLIKQSTVGRLVAEVSAKGTGFDKNTAKGEVSTSIHSIRLQEYVYREIKLDANIDKGHANVYASINDSNVALRLNGDVGFLEGKEYAKAHLNLLGLDLHQLKLQSEQMQASAMADVELYGNAANNFKGHVDVRNILIVKDNKEYKIDSLVAASVNETNRSSMEMSSSIVAAKFNGNIDLFSVVPTAMAHFNHYFEFDKQTPKSEKPQNFDFELKLNESAIVREILMPSLNAYDPVTIKGGFDSGLEKIWLNLDAPSVEYAAMKIKDTRLTIDSDKDKLTYDFGLSSFQNGGLKLEPTSLNGTIRADSIYLNLQIKDSTIGNKLALKSFLTKSESSRFKYSILSDGLSIKNKTWEVDKNNFVEFGSGFLYIHHFNISNEGQSIRAQSSDKTQDANLDIQIKNFHLHSLSQLLEQNDSLVMGTVNGDVQLQKYQKNLAFTSNIAFTDLAYKTSKVGNLYVKADNLTDNRYSVKANINGMDNDVDITGYYSPSDKNNALNIKANINALQLLSIESFTSGQLSASKGIIKGTVMVTGEPSAPIIDGKIRFEEAHTRVSFLNERIYMKNETIEVSNKGVHFPAFTIRDTLDNTAIVDGWIYMEKFNNFKFDLALKTQDFHLLNTTVVQNKMYYGRVIVDSDIKVKGTPELPEIKANIALVGGSYFTYTIPESKLTVDRGDGVMEFLYDANDLHPIMMRRVAEVDKESVLKGIDLEAKIKVDQQTAFKVMIDPSSGDSLVVRGDADLNFAMDPSGKMSLSGIYVLSGGKYKAYIENVVPKEFLLEKGSKIVWNGDPLDAHVDITARYDVKTSARDLMTIGNTGMAITDSSALGRPLLFNVFLIMQGELLKPVISFKLGMPDNQRSAGGGAIYSKINEINGQEAELNKQVFSLLVLSKFMSSTPSGGGGGGASSMARSSVSKLMSDQLNQLSSKYLKGVELDVDLQSYNYSQGGKSQSNTQLNVSAKKSFNRLTVQVGSNVQLEGQKAKQQNNVQSLTGDVQIGYKLTEDGRYQLKAFRQNQVDGIINGIIVETGVGVMYNRNYTTAKELFSAPKKEKLEKQEQEKKK